MTRELRTVAATDPVAVMAALREALAGDGPAVLPVQAGHQGVPPGVVPRRVAVVIETSGSTDAPKLVMLSTDALLAGAAASTLALGGPGQWLLALPAHYIAGVQVLVRSIAAETTPVIMQSGHFDPAIFVEHSEKLTEPFRFTSLVPVQLARLLDAAETDPRVRAALRRFTGILVGGQAVRPELVERAAVHGIVLVRTYGSSETAGGCVYNGVPIGNTAVRVVTVDDGEQLEISGAVLAEGYLGDAERTAERFGEVHGVRWYRTGDLGAVDDETGLVRVLGRADNVIISGGEKVSLDEVQRIVRSLPGLGDVVAVGVDDVVWGQVPLIVRESPAPDARANAGDTLPGLEQIRDAVVSVLGTAARPVRLVTVAKIPLLASGKPDRLALRRL